MCIGAVLRTVVEAGLATVAEKDGKRFYRFDLSNPLKT